MTSIFDQYVALVAHGNALLHRQASLEELPAFGARFHRPDGTRAETPADWLADLQEFRAGRLSLVAFRVTNETDPAHLLVEPALNGVWGVQVEFAKRTELWIAGGRGNLDYRGQPIASALGECPRVADAWNRLAAAYGDALESLGSREPAVAEALRRALAILSGMAAPQPDGYPRDHPDDAKRLGRAARAGWAIAGLEQGGPYRRGPVRDYVFEPVVEATIAAANAV